MSLRGRSAATDEAIPSGYLNIGVDSNPEGIASSG